jgi:hypothetical protein
VRYWLIYFEDQDQKPEIFTSEKAAKERFLSLLPNWNCHLFMECAYLPPQDRLVWNRPLDLRTANASPGAELGSPEAKHGV